MVELLDEGNTVPFITRYRRDQTGGLDEDQIRQIQSRLAKTRLLADRKQTILRSIESQGKLTEQLAKQIHSAGTAKRLEDLYLPYKPKKQTLATLARSRGLESFAREILEADPACSDLDARASDFVNPDRQVPTPADALLGAGHILAEQFSEHAELRQRLREILYRTGKFVSTRIGGDQKDQTQKAPRPERPAEATPEPQPPPEPSGATEKPAEGTENPAPPAEASKTSEPADQPAGTSAAETPDLADPQPAEATQPPDRVDGQSTEATGAVDCPAEQSAEAPETPDPAVDTRVETPPATDNPRDQPAEASQGPDERSQSPAEANPGQAPEAAAAQPAEATPEQPAEAPTAEPGKAGPEQSAEAPTAQSAEAAPEQSAEAPTAQPAEAGAEGQGGEPSPPAAPPTASRAVAPAAKARQKPGALSRSELRKKKAEEKRVKAFRDYFDYSEEIKKIPPHRVLAINRGERAKVLRVKIESDVEAMHRVLDELLIPPEHPHAEYLRGCARDALSRLILPSLEREIRRELTDRAETHAVGVFARNLRNLLLQPPVRDRRVLAVDPGFKSGCKLAALDQFGNLLEHGVIYLVGRPERRKQAQQKATDLIDRYQLSAVVIGNGTACRQTEEFFAELIAGELKDRGVTYVIVNEAGASVYSTSRTGREEFPNYDASLRGAISIGRRLQDPLSELVKIDAANIGVGLYQHDVKAKHLRGSLDEVVESCVNYVGVDVNTASPALLRYVSGLNQLTARHVYEHRREQGPFRSRVQLREVPGFGEATFVQAAGFLKIAAGENPLDATWIHPESYDVADRVLVVLGSSAADLKDKEAAAALAGRVAEVDLDAMAKELGVGGLTLKDILAQLARPGRDPREDLPAPVFKQGVLKLEDLTPGMELTGTVLNVVDFGAFVDIGMHDSGLVHVSQLADKYVRDPHEVVAVGDIVRVWVIDVDKERRRVSLSMIPPGTQRTRRPRRGGKPDQAKGPAETADGREEKPARARESRRPKSKARPKGKGPPRRKGQPRPKYRPKPPPKPLVPITEAMKAGKEPMRTFGDLAQYFEQQQDESDGATQDEAQNAESQTPATKDQAEDKPSQPATTYDQAQGEEAEVTTTQDAPQSPPEQDERSA